MTGAPSGPGLRRRVAGVVERVDTRAGRAFDLVIQALILVSAALFAIDTLPDLAPSTRTLVRRIELVIVLVFTAEYALRLWVAERRGEFATSFFGIVDLLAIVPFWLGLAVDTRSARLLRLLRLVQLLKLARYNRALRRLRRALAIAREEIVLYVGVTLVLLFLAAAGIWHFEHEAQPEVFASVFSSLWWAVVTLTTVGYGDAYPVTVGGRTFTFALLFVGIGIVTVPAGIVASALSRARELED